MKISFGNNPFDFRFRPSHGPQFWPWWRLFSLSIVKLRSSQNGWIGWRLWIYTRWGASSWDLYVLRGSR